MNNPPEILVLVPLMLAFIPILAMVLRHRQRELEIRLAAGRKTAEPSDSQQAQIDALQAQMKEMKAMMQEQMIAVDTIISNQQRLLAGQESSDLQNRLGPVKEASSGTRPS